MFRVIISGKFDALTDSGRDAILAADGIAFTEAGTFTHDGSLSAFTFRCQLPAGPGEGENEATGRAIAALDAYGQRYRILRTAVTDMRDIKIRRKGRG
ncbi:DUF6204 family protein [Streptosporangium minutum]|uniref:Uncharacterized protein n=1 Tax=Streptosporangium minutum TaxID=569862 RepID=A0A2C9ZMS6_9ACTN|nr:DUF6204 family protein [Streptosporangium minutum]OUC98709.1 hypothetical protein CA984_06200 [Streptosporangium minutum]